MQTLKTAAVVVLLMTVVYGVWVPLTTPPEELPPEVADMLVVSDDLDIDTGLPESLESIAAGHREELSASAGESIASNVPQELSGNSQALTVPQAHTGVSYGTSFADLQPAPGSGTNASISDHASSVSEVPATNKLPNPESGSSRFASSPRGDYPSTGNEFDLPDPQTAVTSFSAETGTEFRPPNDLPTDESTNPISLSSGTTATDLLAPPDAAASHSDVSRASGENLGLRNAILTADRQYVRDQKKEALSTLSLFYNTPNMSAQQRSELLSRLDPLAREVIYSKSHLLEQPHRVGANETLMEIAERYEVPWQLLANINAIRDPVTVLPGTELKVLRGPFNAQVDLTTKELTLFLGDLYAGRFPIAVGTDPEPQPGTFTVQDMQTSHTYYDSTGTPIPAGSPDNPYGNMWVDLGGRICIHGSPNTMKPSTRGCISLADDQASDLYGILTQGSLVTIRR